MMLHNQLKRNSHIKDLLTSKPFIVENDYDGRERLNSWCRFWNQIGARSQNTSQRRCVVCNAPISASSFCQRKPESRVPACRRHLKVLKMGCTP